MRILPMAQQTAPTPAKPVTHGPKPIPIRTQTQVLSEIHMLNPQRLDYGHAIGRSRASKSVVDIGIDLGDATDLEVR